MVIETAAEKLKPLVFRDNDHRDYISQRGLHQLNEQERAFYYAMLMLCEKTAFEDRDKYYIFGYQAFGPLLYGFCKWMIRELELEGLDQVLFFARDGYIIQRAFELLPESSKFDSKYMYVSRRSLCVPQLWAAKDEERMRATSMMKYISVGEWLVSVGLDVSDYEDIAIDCGLTLTEVFKDEEFFVDERTNRLVRIVWPDIKKNSRVEFNTAMRYIKQLNIAGRCGVVDIGWRGSIQRFMSKLLELGNVDSELIGFYVALSGSMHRGQKMRGFVGGDDETTGGCDLLRGYVGLIETMFLRTEGSVKRYVEGSDGQVVPSLYEYEYMENGVLASEALHVDELQRGALQFVSDYVEIGEPIDNPSQQVAIMNLADFANRPTWDAIHMFGGFRFFNNGSVTKLAGSNSPLHNVTHPRDLKKDLYGSRWRIAFLKRNMIIPLPYLSIFNLLMRAAY